MARLLALILLLWSGPLVAQGAATLLADELRLDGGQSLVASGNVEVVFEGTRLRASAIRYDGLADRLEISGPIWITGPDGTILQADAASLSPDLRNGLLTGARLVLDRQLQLAAGRIDRVDGRYTALSGVAVTSCPVCGGGPPLWEIRASQVVHDQAERQLYFTDAQFRVGGVPVVWVPRLRLPDPTLDRATGLLIPRLRTTDRLGFGVKVPAFFTLGDHRDITLTPYLSAETRTLEFRYRQALAQGDLSVEGAMSRDTIRPESWRGYLFADGQFNLGPGRVLTLRGEVVSDDGYLFDYGIADLDRLHSHLTYAAVSDQHLTLADLSFYDSLRDGEDAGALPPVVAEWRQEWTRTLGPDSRLTFGLSAEAYVRTDPGSGDQARDAARLSADIAWAGRRILPSGLILQGQVGAALDWQAIAEDPTLPETAVGGRMGGAAVLSWPLVRHTGTATQVIEPLVALTWRGSAGERPLNEDAQLVEFDSANLAAPWRAPGQDGRESGADLALGLRFSHQAQNGRAFGLDLGRVFRSRVEDAFSAASGLGGLSSDWVIGAYADLGDGFVLQARSLMDQSLRFGKTEARVEWAGARMDLAAAYLWLPADSQENRAEPISEWTIDASYRLTEAWTLRADARYDIVADQPARLGLGLTYEGACVTVDLSVRRRYTSTEAAEPETDFGFSVTLDGFSTGRQARSAATCG